MKKKLLYLLSFTTVLSFNCFSQNAFLLNSKKVNNSQSNSIAMTDETYIPKQKIKYYRVEEISNAKFGGYKTTYTVTEISLIRSYSLGPNNTRIITPVMVDAEPITALDLQAKNSYSFSNIKNLTISESATIRDKNAYVDIIKTYEMMANKGYKSVEMLKKIANAYYFNDELEKAAKNYTELLELTSDFEPEIYYRYSVTLKYINKPEKANEMLKKFNQLSGNTTN